ncbi:hypothetical protein PHLGIDRAFT_499161 [Phlebiopsis gigantea 11061_1 CR5-6]|uniref:Cytochrome P450 monooxygenase n=1 Tax=Phlebiopsis gigantea (strain 11061_1 CR5-6) TaxID=745531 RepID=A0A0C3NXS0_PHLG1|nr:hypothetical protein PHLGIDRAFT_499161 [Phlebiopsis gigantea 11061_1 CR5-6]
MDALNHNQHLDPKFFALVPVIVLVLAYIVPLLSDRHGLRKYPGPFLAKVTNMWFARMVMNGDGISSVHKLHEKHGRFVRLSPKQVSIADPEALHAIYSYSAGTLKGDIYDGFVLPGRKPSIFATRQRDEHSRKRKYLSHVMSMKSIQELEHNILHHQQTLVQQWDKLCLDGAQDKDGSKGSCEWKAKEGRVWFNCMPWFNFEAFDIIGDLAFGASFGMLESGKDAAPVALSEDEAVNSYYSDHTVKIECTTVPAVKTINETVDFNTFLGCFPPQWHWVFLKLPMFQKSLHTRSLLARMAITALAKRLASGEARADFLTKLIAARDDNGQPLPEHELSAEALSLLVAGSDTTSNSAGAITYHLARNQVAQAKLQAELDKALGLPGAGSNEAEVPTYDQLKYLTYLQDVINEGLRVHSTAGIGLPRVIPEGGLTVAGESFVEGTEVSCPIYTMHHLKSVWGDDADVFNPDRWSGENKAELMQSFAPFSVGPRACIGRHLALIELTIGIATIFHRYHIVLEDPNGELPVHEGFLRKPECVHIGMKRRGAR